MSKRDPSLLIEDMIESIQRIEKYTEGMDYSSFVQDDKTIDAVVRNFEIIGEAANRLGREFHQAHDQVEWNRMRGFRNRIVHHYFGIDYEIVWSIIENDIGILKQKLKNLME